MGFDVRIGLWFGIVSRPWAEVLLDEKRLQVECYFHPATIRRKWAEHLEGRVDNTASLWAVLVFQDWLQEIG